MSTGIGDWKSMDFDQFQYEFGDSSVPPPYHRSYTITLKGNELLFVVDSYGDILLEQRLDISADFKKEVRSLLKTFNIEHKKKTISDGCAGGTTKYIRLYKNGVEVFKGGLYFCAGDSYGDLSGDLNGFSQSFIQTFLPDLQKRIQTTE